MIENVEDEKQIEKEQQLLKARYESLKLLHDTSTVEIKQLNGIIKSLKQKQQQQQYQQQEQQQEPQQQQEQ